MKIKFGVREKIILFVVIYLGAIFLWYKFLYLPKNNELKRIKQELKSIQMQYKPFLGDTFRPPLLEEETAISEKYHELTAKIPERDEIPSAMIQMAKIGQGRDIRILSTKPVTSRLFAKHRLPKGSQLKEIPVDMVLEGRFVDIGRYLFDLMNLPFLGGYNKIQMETSKKIYPEIRANITCLLLFFDNRQKHTKRRIKSFTSKQAVAQTALNVVLDG
ncbi:MAG: type 4a pilus biogenesis protein PilO [Deltaproteobacteria bacterium]|nr:type 4a pilus biogenesis protein PilO [Deltaproteobacteria bacterium]MBW2019273.1 type 4a pilus biogenesis protein PilO [Deltaproteobacteria bacterium]MBW2074106.1 type 4a pilus biogenesis protein PilO [Deltaproteobacteria bacterium]RLB82565.1 MAG: hypothetical protein DRH17_05355 [Deltaproteobacteria bacterium]